MRLDAARLLFPTQEAEPVEISVERNGVEITIYTAAEENIGILLYGDIAYLSIRSFTKTTGEEVRLDFNDLQAEAGGSVDKLIIDVRGDGGGSASGALEMIDYLIDNDSGVSLITTVSGPAYGEETRYLGDYCEFNIGDFDETSFVLLVDEDSASASEMLASTLKYYGTAYLIGETTYGKGIGQTIVELIDESGAVVPAFESLPPSGVSYHLVGISPDYYLAAPATAFNNDPVLDAAVEYLNNGNVTVSASGSISGKHRIAVSEKIVDPLKKSLLKRNISSHYY
jgi:carboxyl-terminal processing protease